MWALAHAAALPHSYCCLLGCCHLPSRLLPSALTGRRRKAHRKRGLRGPCTAQRPHLVSVQGRCGLCFPLGPARVVLSRATATAPVRFAASLGPGCGEKSHLLRRPPRRRPRLRSSLRVLGRTSQDNPPRAPIWIITARSTKVSGSYRERVVCNFRI